MNGKRWAALGIAAVLFFVSIAVGTATTAIYSGYGKYH